MRTPPPPPASNPAHHAYIEHRRSSAAAPRSVLRDTPRAGRPSADTVPPATAVTVALTAGPPQYSEATGTVAVPVGATRTASRPVLPAGRSLQGGGVALNRPRGKKNTKRQVFGSFERKTKRRKKGQK